MSRVGRRRESSASPEGTGFVKELFRAVNNGHMGTPKTTRIVVLGKTGVGKSALVVRFLTKRFIWEYDPTLENIYKHTTVIDDEPVTFEILDTAGTGEEMQLDAHINWADGFMLVYSVTDKDSFHEIFRLHQHISSVKKGESFPCVIVGNKNDMDHARCVSVDEGEKLSVDLASSFFECSACDGDELVHEAFKELHRDVNRKRLSYPRRRRSSAQHVIQAFNKMFTRVNS